MRKRTYRTRLFAQIENEHNQHNEPILDSEGQNNKNLEIEQEIDCPRCQDIMTLSSDFDRFGYVCEECDFLLYLN
jgi:hypothetical protein